MNHASQFVQCKESLAFIRSRDPADSSSPLKSENWTIRAMDPRQIKAGPEDFGLMTYDPAFMSTASCKSAITFIDGDKGILRYRGYPAGGRAHLPVAV